MIRMDSQIYHSVFLIQSVVIVIRLISVTANLSVVIVKLLTVTWTNILIHNFKYSLLRKDRYLRNVVVLLISFPVHRNAFPKSCEPLLKKIFTQNGNEPLLNSYE